VGQLRAGLAVLLVAVLLSACTGAADLAGPDQSATTGRSAGTQPTGHTPHGGDGDQTSPAPPSKLRTGERFAVIGLPGGAYAPAAPSGGKVD
jgi:hypothetical protein